MILASLAGTHGLLGCDSSSSSYSAGPSISNTRPTDGASGVVRNTSVSATFDEDIFASTVDSSSFTLAAGSAVSGTVSFDGSTNEASFMPDDRLGLLSTYTATLSTAITDLSGNPLASEYSWAFTTEDGGWTGAELAETNTAGHAASPVVAMDGDGNAIAVWYQNDSGRSNIWATRYTPADGWGIAELIETNNDGDALFPDIAFDGLGNAFAVWRQSDGVTEHIWANRYQPGSGWDTAQPIESNSGTASAPRVVADGSGNVIAVWPQADSASNDIWANRYTPTDGWDTTNAILIETDAGDANAPKIAMDSNGNAIAVWHQRNSGYDEIRANRYTFNGTWSDAVTIDNGDPSSANNPLIAFDGNGNGFVVWHESGGGGTSNIWSNRYIPGSGWDSAEKIENDETNPAYGLDMDVDDQGNAIAIWSQWAGGYFSIVANRYVTGSGWGNPELIETLDEEVSIGHVKIDTNGNAVAIWRQRINSEFSIWANRYVNGEGWGTAELLENKDIVAYAPSLAMDGEGKCMAVWSQDDNTSNHSVWSNRFE